MIVVPNRCLEAVEIQEVLAGRASEEAFDSAISHLDECDRCRAKAESLESSGKWLVESLADHSVDPLQAETACQIALWRMLNAPNQVMVRSNERPCDQLGPYKLVHTLGVGGMGTVYLAEHERLKRSCAVKLLPRERVDQPGWLDRFDREMTTVAGLEHPNIVRATDAGHQDGWHYLVMEHLDGLDVGQIASRIGRLNVADACEIVRQAANGLGHVHESGLVHRDIKPSNLMLTLRGEVKLLDLGLVLAGDDPLSKDERLTTVGHMMGTMPYMAPEQLADSHQVSAAADIYSLGATLFRLLAGHPPHKRTGTIASQILSISGKDAVRLDKLRDDIDSDLVSLVASMLSRDPGQRPANASEVGVRLGEFAAGNRLKSLVRESLRRPSGDSNPISMLPSVASQSPPPRRRLPGWMISAIFGASIALFGFLIKIQTDKGELVVHSELDDCELTIVQGDDVVESLTVERDAKKHIRLHKGNYRVTVKTDGKPLKLNNDVVTITRGNETPFSIAPLQLANRQGRLFKGQALAYWMDLLLREEDPVALHEIIQAVEVLSRGTPRREEAARQTLLLARKLGHYSLQNSEPEKQFIDHFLNVFPRYIEQSEFALVSEELEHGNFRSMTAVTMMLKQWSIRGSDYTQADSDRLKDLVKRIVATPEGKLRLKAIIASLPRVAKMQAAGWREIPSDFWLTEANGVGLRLADLAELPIRGTYLEKYVRQATKDAQNRWNLQRSSMEGVHGGSGFAVYGQPYDIQYRWLILSAALKFATEDGGEQPWEYFAQNIGEFASMGRSIRGEYWTAVAENAPQMLSETLIWNLKQLPNQPMGGGWIQTNSNRVWWRSLRFLGEQGPPREILELATKIRDHMRSKWDDVNLAEPKEYYAMLEEVIDRSKQRMQNSVAENAKDGNAPSRQQP